jgi:hypothetical protein
LEEFGRNFMLFISKKKLLRFLKQLPCKFLVKITFYPITLEQKAAIATNSGDRLMFSFGVSKISKSIFLCVDNISAVAD